MVFLIMIEVVLLAAGFFLLRLLLAYRRNWKLAKESGYPYVLAPVHILEPAWFAVAPLFIPIVRLLPRTIKEPWISLIDFRRVWHEGRGPFNLIGSNSFVVVTPSGNVLWTCDPDAFRQVSNKCENPPGTKDMWRMYGPNLLSSGGNQRKVFRKTITSAFGEATLEKVWHTALKEVQVMLARYPIDGNGSKSIHNVNQDARDLMLHIISKSLYGRDCRWDSREHDGIQMQRPISYNGAIKAIIENLYTVCFTPKALLKNLPFRNFRRANAAFEDWGYHMRKLRDGRQEMSMLEQEELQSDLLGVLVRAKVNNLISADAVTGNMFITLVAGHETTATTLSFALAALAVLPTVQTELQADLDRIVTTKSIPNWSYRKECAALLDGYVGAVIFETLRLWTPLPGFMKANLGPDQGLRLTDRTYPLYHGSTVFLHATAAHTNPTYWPRPNASLSSGEDLPFPLSDFNPHRWFRDNEQSSLISAEFSEPHSAVNEKITTQQQKRRLVSVRNGLFAPWGEGPTSCPGNRMAVVEFAAALAYICKHWWIRPATPATSSINAYGHNKAADRAARARLIRQITKGVEFNLVVQTMESISIRLEPRLL